MLVSSSYAASRAKPLSTASHFREPADNDNCAGRGRIEWFGWTFCPGDKVMQTENDYDKEVYNGDRGVVSRIDLEESELTAEFEGREDGLDRSVWHRHRY